MRLLARFTTRFVADVSTGMEPCLERATVHEETVLAGSGYRGQYRTVRVLVDISHFF
jgi:hypothetical protein